MKEAATSHLPLATSQAKKSGFTLIELVVYMAILGFIIVVAGRVFSDSTGMRVRTQSMTKATEEANKIAELIKEDLSQMGAKSWFRSSASSAEFTEEAKVYMSATSAGTAGDSSSFTLTANNSDITFRKIAYSNDGKCIGIRNIRWWRDAGARTLNRSCYTTAGGINCPTVGTGDPESAACPVAASASSSVVMATDVEKFTLIPSKPRTHVHTTASTYVNPTFPFGGPASSGSSATFGLVKHVTGNGYTAPADMQSTAVFQHENTMTVRGVQTGASPPYTYPFKWNSSSSGKMQHQVFVTRPIGTTSTVATAATGKIECQQFMFVGGETYEIKFKTPMPQTSLFSANVNGTSTMLAYDSMSLFKPARDHMAVGFRDPSNPGNPIPELKTDFMFYPPLADNAQSINQSFEFSVPKSLDGVCVAFTFAFYSGNADVGPHKGKVRIQDFEIRQKTSGFYDFDESLDMTVAKIKNDVKAFGLVLDVRKRDEIGSVKGYVIPTPNNGVVL